MKRIISFITCLLLLTSMSIGTIATSIDDISTDTDEYLVFTPSLERIASDGSFDFYMRIRVTSNKFYATSNTLRINTAAKIYDQATSSSYTDKSIQFRVTLYKSSGTKVGSYVGNADNIYGGKTFNVTSGQKYYIEITSLYDFTGTGKYIDGYGKASPILLS